MNAGTQLYHIVASNAYHKDTEDFYISLKIVDVKQPEGDQRVIVRQHMIYSLMKSQK